jgi:hypothetical protein
MTASGMNGEFVVQGTLIPARQHQGEEEMPGTVDTMQKAMREVGMTGDRCGA